ncbi:hypothetical protein NLI96_g2905 [Meripilus lineatus]|uniref:Gfd2/YDR514C-like C-terminal domain-containing protein n=1 Tax=Meripilus lineatus TaxID=2056292 RepID=A0AAD5VA10_9APHY|nr:hypothetical protein NLI96_g2905 [Physisporinus lineatus]
MTTSSTIIGYYRFTDIYFEWHKALPNAEDIGPLKALLAYDALVHPDHPLRKKGIDGIELFIGTFENGEARLLFSSAQVEYMRYWLHAMQLTLKPIPLPAMEYMITQGSLLSCSPSIYRDAPVLKKAIRVIEKNNKRIKGAQPLLTARRLYFEKVRTFWASKRGTWISMDFEAWERDHTLLLEFGWSIVRWADGEEVLEDGHLIVKERQAYQNHILSLSFGLVSFGLCLSSLKSLSGYQNYQFGTSFKVDKKQFKANVCELLERYRSDGPVFLVFHDHNQDVKYLRGPGIEAPIEDLTILLPDTTPTEGLYVIDTAELFAALEGSETKQNQSLQTVCRRLKIPTKFLHNAGNDAHYTMLAAKAMASGDPVDDQRAKRWPELVAQNQNNLNLEQNEAVIGNKDPYEELEEEDNEWYQ